MSGRGNVRNLNGSIVRISGDDDRLNGVLDDLESVAYCEVLSRGDLEQAGTGMLTIQARAAVRPNIVEIARKHGLEVADE